MRIFLIIPIFGLLVSSTFPQSASLYSPNTQKSGLFGESISTVPDINGDGHDDLVCGARREFNNVGRAYVFSGQDGTLIHQLESSNPIPEGIFGRWVLGLNDIDHDGAGDIAVSAVRESVSGKQSAGRVYFFSGKSGQLLGQLESPNPEAKGLFGWEIDSLLDVDGDGKDDIVISAFGESPAANKPHAGRVYVYSTKRMQLLHTINSPNFPMIAPDLKGNFGNAITGMGDLDKDGKGDFAVGAPSDFPDLGGAVYTISGATGEIIQTIRSPRPTAKSGFGSVLGSVSSAKTTEHSLLIIGRNIFDPISGSELITLDPSLTAEATRVTVAEIDDMNGDARAEVVIGGVTWSTGNSPKASGRVYILSGLDGKLLGTLISPSEIEGGNFGTDIAVLKKDGIPNRIAVGAFRERAKNTEWAGAVHLFDLAR